MYSGVEPHPRTSHHAFPLSPSLENGTPNRPLLSLPFVYQQKPRLPEVAPLQRSGLRTPPFEEMGTTYQAPTIAPYESHTHALIPGYPASMAQADRARSALSGGLAALDSYPRYSHQQPPHPQQSRPQVQAQAVQQLSQTPLDVQPPPQPQSNGLFQHQGPPARSTLSSVSQASSQPNSAISSRPATPKSGRSMASQGSISRKEVVSLAHQSLEIPACISPRGGSLSDFSAQLTCFFWFESREVHQLAEKVDQLPPSEPIRRLTQAAVPCQNFKNWVHAILSTTQVTQNVILLALLFVNRLKVGNPTVKGRPGSEYRLLTVALMLGNKFLDDNTYLNKTWAEVSGISVKEIHVMEVEFLSNMRYSLLVKKEEWESWLVRLTKIWRYCEAATRPMPTPIAIPSPTHLPVGHSPIPSPTGHLLPMPGMHSTPPVASTFSPSYAHPPRTLGSSVPWPSTSSAPIQSLSPLANKPDSRNGSGKRSYYDDDPTEPPAKRTIRQPQPLPSQSLPPNSQSRPVGTAPQAAPLRLPVPNLTLNTAPQMSIASSYYPTSSHVPVQQSALSLPPLVPGIRAMATVYPQTTSAGNVMIPSSGPSVVPSSVSTPITSTTPSGFPVYGTPSKRHSPGSLTPAAAAALGNSSPLGDSFSHGHASGIHTPISHSPSVYLQHRASPYRPVRHVNTLLYPPPSASLHEYHLSGAGMIPPTQMQYQPLGRRNEFRTGIVPEFTHLAQQQQQHHYARQGLSMTPVSRPMLASNHPQQQQQQQRSGMSHSQGQPHMHYPN